MSNKVVVAYITHNEASKAKDLAKKLVENQLVACVNIVPSITSIYSWKGKIEEDNEVLMIVKTMSDKKDEVIDFVKKNHGYETPEVIFTDINGGNKDYLKWVDSSTRKIEKKK